MTSHSQGKKKLVARLIDIIETSTARSLRVDLIRDDIREAIERIQELEARLADPRNVTLTRERYFHLLKLETVAERVIRLIAKKKREERWKLQSSVSQSCSSSVSSSEH